MTSFSILEIAACSEWTWEQRDRGSDCRPGLGRPLPGWDGRGQLVAPQPLDLQRGMLLLCHQPWRAVLGFASNTLHTDIFHSMNLFSPCYPHHAGVKGLLCTFRLTAHQTELLGSVNGLKSRKLF